MDFDTMPVIDRHENEHGVVRLRGTFDPSEGGPTITVQPEGGEEVVAVFTNLEDPEKAQSTWKDFTGQDVEVEIL